MCVFKISDVQELLLFRFPFLSLFFLGDQTSRSRSSHMESSRSEASNRSISSYRSQSSGILSADRSHTNSVLSGDRSHSNTVVAGQDLEANKRKVTQLITDLHCKNSFGINYTHVRYHNI